MNIRKAKINDLPQILQIYKSARDFMKETGNAEQWGDQYPTRKVLKEDIRSGNLYVVKNQGAICAVFAFIVGKEPTYEKITQGHWLSDTEYGTLHRVAGDGTAHGIFDMVLAFCSQKTSHLRIDTHSQNKIMQHLILKNNFQKCGIIYVADGSPRIAYERLQ